VIVVRRRRSRSSPSRPIERSMQPTLTEWATIAAIAALLLAVVLRTMFM
jgi:hypothetical protein